MKFYSISPKWDKNVEYTSEHIISISYVAQNYELEVGNEIHKTPKATKQWIRSRRALGIKAIHGITKNHDERKFRCLCHYDNWMIVTQDGKGERSIRKYYIERF